VIISSLLVNMDDTAPKKRCPGDSPFCLGLPEWDCCGTQGLLECKNATTSQPSAENDSDTNGPIAKAPKMSLQLHKQKKMLSPSSRFNKTEEIDVFEGMHS